MPAFPRSLLLLPLFVVLAACRQAAPSLPAIQVEISHVVAAAPLVIGETLTTPAGETLSVKRLQYYLSNPRLLRADGSWQAPPQDLQSPEGYYLIDAAKPETTHFLLPPAPAGEYSGVEFTIGVDETRNGSGAQTGALDPAHGMFWTWATGYIHFKLEGSSPASPEADHTVTLHLGGNGLQRTVFLPFAPKPVRVSADIQPTVHLHADLAAFLGGAAPLKFAEQPLVMQAKDGLPLADRLGSLLSVDHIHHEPAGAPHRP
ncbi:MbnP family protein [uncultured Nevskia sp.]|uniref:MbnP family protein n=1 Tax=uncultured Nevskia sp. TaxID=228950 RepID=UPI0025CC0590|nr:MbnP family protein [uncultured Nevskia sp.]